MDFLWCFFISFALIVCIVNVECAAIVEQPQITNESKESIRYISDGQEAQADQHYIQKSKPFNVLICTGIVKKKFFGQPPLYLCYSDDTQVNPQKKPKKRMIFGYYAYIPVPPIATEDCDKLCRIINRLIDVLKSVRTFGKNKISVMPENVLDLAAKLLTSPRMNRLRVNSGCDGQNIPEVWLSMETKIRDFCEHYTNKPWSNFQVYSGRVSLKGGENILYKFILGNDAKIPQIAMVISDQCKFPEPFGELTTGDSSICREYVDERFVSLVKCIPTGNLIKLLLKTPESYMRLEE